LETVEIMKELGFALTNKVYTHLITACAAGKRRDLVQRFYEEAEKEGYLDLHMYTSVVRALGRIGDLDDAWDLIIKLQKDPRYVNDTVIYTSFIKSCTEHKDYDRAWYAYWFMKESGIEPDSLTYTTMMYLCVETDRTERAFLFLEEMDKAQIPLIETNYNALIHACAKRNDAFNYQKAFEMFRRMKDEGYIPELHTYNALINVCARRGDIKTCELIFDEMMDRRTGTFGPNHVTYGLLLYCYAFAIENIPKEERAELVTKAQALFETILQETGGKVTTQPLNALLKLYANAHMVGSALTFFEKYPDYGLKQDEDAYVIMIKMFNRLIDPEKAQETFAKLRNAGINPSKRSYLVMIQGCVRAGYYKRAIKFIREMRLHGFFPHVEDLNYFRYKIKREYPEMYEEITKMCDETRDHEKYYYAPKVIMNQPP